LESQCKSLKDTVSEKEAEIKYVKRDREDYLKDKLNLALENKRLQNELEREKRANTSRMITDEDKIDNGRSLTLPDELSTGTSQLTTPRGNNMAGTSGTNVVKGLFSSIFGKKDNLQSSAAKATKTG
jgi:hypothetical protein